MAYRSLPKLHYIFKRDHWMLGYYQVLRECEMCGMIGDHKNIRNKESHTLYYWDGEGKNPNRDLILCRKCSKEYDEIMDSWWADVFSY